MGFFKDRKEIAQKYQQELLRSKGESPVPHPKSGIGNIVIVGIILLVVAGAVVNYTTGGESVDDSYWCESNPSIPAFSENCGKPILKKSNQIKSDTVQDSSWKPANFEIWLDNPNVAWRWLKGNEFRCDYGDACWGMMIIAKEGCPNSLYAELSILDANDVQISYTNDSLSSTLPMQKSKMIFETYEEDAESARISKISCY